MEHDHQHAKSVIPEGAETAKDPVCGMTVAIGPDTQQRDM
jgi:Cu+-exporting ATPase